MTPSSKKLFISFLAAAGMGLSARTVPAADATVFPEPQALTDPAITMVIKDEKNNLACFESPSGSGLSCATPHPGAGLSIQKVTPIASGNGGIIAHRIIDQSSGIACYVNQIDLWCHTLPADKAGSTADFSISTTLMGTMGETTRIHDHQTGLVIYTNNSALSGAAPGTPQPEKEKEITDFTHAAMQRIRDYETGITCYFAPAANHNFACTTLTEDTVTGTDIRAILKVGDPLLHYNIIDQGSNGIVINVGDEGICAVHAQPTNAKNSNLDFKDIPTLTGGKITRIIDERLGMVTYSNAGGLSCGLLAPAPKP